MLEFLQKEGELMKTWIVRVMFAMILIFIGYAIGNMNPAVVKAQNSKMVPKSWGHVVGFSGSIPVFEDAAGTLRFPNGEVLVVRN